MVSNDVEALAVGEACPALLLTAKARVIAPLVVWRRGEEDFLVLTEPGLGDRVHAELLRLRFRARCEIEAEEHESVLVFGGEDGFATDWPGAREVLDSELEPTLDAAELELRRIEAGVPRWGHEIDDKILPAEAGLDATHISFSKGCYPGQEPIARLHYRGHANRELRVVELGDDAEVERVTSRSRRGPTARVSGSPTCGDDAKARGRSNRRSGTRSGRYGASSRRHIAARSAACSSTR